MSKSKELQARAINTIRFLSADGVQQAKSGHPGLPMGTAAMAYALWTRHLRFNPRNPDWPGPRPIYPFRRSWLHAALQPFIPDRI